jgi:acylphosphatase
VGFRYYCQEEAQRLGLAGTVRNLDDGDVEVLARGPRHRVDALIAWLHRGPRWSRVTGVRVTEVSPDAVRGTSFQVGN